MISFPNLSKEKIQEILDSPRNHIKGTVFDRPVRADHYLKNQDLRYEEKIDDQPTGWILTREAFILKISSENFIDDPQVKFIQQWYEEKWCCNRFIQSRGIILDHTQSNCVYQDHDPYINKIFYPGGLRQTIYAYVCSSYLYQANVYGEAIIEKVKRSSTGYLASISLVELLVCERVHQEKNYQSDNKSIIKNLIPNRVQPTMRPTFN
jgi:hypothetical protein